MAASYIPSLPMADFHYELPDELIARFPGMNVSLYENTTHDSSMLLYIYIYIYTHIYIYIVRVCTSLPGCMVIHISR